ncbi:MAG: metal-dependent hydrolase [Anaerolineae bacterium]|nr:metal-dependent hydrolase [Anaerolineae bacterium]
MIAAIGRALYKARAHIVNLIPFLTHSLAALLPLAWAVALGRVDLRWKLIVAAVVIGNLADVDTSYSHVGRVLYPLSRIIERRFGHRTPAGSRRRLAADARRP